MTSKEWRGFLALLPGTALAFMDQTILPVALPTIRQELGASNLELQWCVNAYILAIAVLVLVSGKLSDRIGDRKALSFGIVGFTLFSALCGMSLDIGMLIGARALQGAAATFIFTTQGSFVARIFRPEDRGKIIGMLASIGSLFMILAPVVGGYLVSAASWRWIFWINLPIGALGLWAILAFLPSCQRGGGKIDLAGFGFFAISTSAFVLIFMQAVDWGWSSIKTLTCVALTLIFLFLLLWREKKTAHPLLDGSLFKHPIYTAANVSVTIVQFIMMISVFRTIYFQDILDYTPVQTGMITGISTFPILFMAPIAGFLSDRLNPRLPIALGYLALIFSFFWMGFSSTPSFLSLVAALTLFGIGLPFILTPSLSAAMSSVPSQKIGSAFGMLYTLRMLGSSVGLALINVFVTTVQEHHTSEGQRSAEIASYSAVHFALAFLLIIIFALTFVLHSRKSAHQLPSSPAEGWD